MRQKTLLVVCVAVLTGAAGVASAQYAPAQGPVAPVAGGAQPAPAGSPPGYSTTVAAGGAPATYPVAIARRPQTLGAGTLAIGDGSPEMVSGVFDLAHISICIPNPVGGGETCASDTAVGMTLGASYGVTDDLQLDARVLPLQLSPDFDYGALRVGATFRFVRGSVDVGARAGFVLSNEDKLRPGIDVGVPVDLHLGDTARLSTGIFLNVAFESDTTVGLGIPLVFAVNATPEIALGAVTGFDIMDLGHAGDTILVPLSVFGAYTVADSQSRPMLDVGPFFGFPLFLTPSADGDKVHTDLWQLGLLARFHVFT